MIQQTKTSGWWDVSAKDYYKDHDRVSCSMLKDFLGWRPDYRDFYVTKRREREETESMKVGKAFHKLLLEPATFDLEYHCPPDGMNIKRNTKEGKANWEALEEDPRILLTTDQRYEIECMKDACHRHEQVNAALKVEGVREQSFFSECEETGLLLKGRPDIALSNGIVLDIKTSSDVSKDAWLRQARSLRYHMQAAFYLDCLSRFTRAKIFVHVVVGRYEPWPVVVYRLKERAIENGRLMYQAALKDLAYCIETDDWSDPAEHGIIEIDFPEWHYRQEG